MLDESLLDAPEALARLDAHGLLRGAAEAGARVRTAARHAIEAGLADLKPDGRPRAVLVAGPGAAGGAIADLLSAFCGGSCPVTRLAPTGVAPVAGALRWALPGWAGPLDLLLIATPDGTEPGLPPLVEQAYRRGCSVVAVTPTDSPLTSAVAQARGLMVPLEVTTYDTGVTGATGAADPPDAGAHAPEGAQPPGGPYAVGGPYAGGGPPGAYDPYAGPAGRKGAPGDAPADGTGVLPAELTRAATLPGTLWAMLAPLLILVDRIGLLSVPEGAVERVAERLDLAAERCGPATATYGNPAKTLATELADALPLVWTEGPVAAAAGRRFAGLLAALAGRPALVAALPEALAEHGALLAGTFAGEDTDDFFRDRVEEPAALRARIVLMRDEPVGALSAVPAARELALAQDTPVSELEAEQGAALDAAVDLLATTDFAAVYLALAASDNG